MCKQNSPQSCPCGIITCLTCVSMPAMLQGTGKMEAVVSEDWTPQTIDSWRHSVWVGMVDPWIVVGKPHLW